MRIIGRFGTALALCSVLVVCRMALVPVPSFAFTTPSVNNSSIPALEQLNEVQDDHYTFFPYALCNYCIDFYDNFFDPASGWPIIDNEYLQAFYDTARYWMLAKTGGYVYIVKAPTCIRENYSVEVSAKWWGGEGRSLGLAFGITSDFNSYYVLELNAYHSVFWITRSTPDGFALVVPPTFSSAIEHEGGANHIKVTRMGSAISVAFNGINVGTWYDTGITGLTGTGLVVSKAAEPQPTFEAAFSAFEVKTIDDSAVNDAGGSQAAAVLEPLHEQASSLPFLPVRMYPMDVVDSQ